MAIRQRLVITSPAILPRDASEGLRARHWREHVMGLSRPALAALVGVTVPTIARYETEGPPKIYRLACAAIALQMYNWQWAGVTKGNPALELQYNEILDRIREDVAEILEDLTPE